MFIHESYPWLGASLDAILMSPHTTGDTLTNVEIKWVMKELPDHPHDIKVRYAKHILQVQTQMLVTGIKGTLLVFYKDGQATVFLVKPHYPLMREIANKSLHFLLDVKAKNNDIWKRTTNFTKIQYQNLVNEVPVLAGNGKAMPFEAHIDAFPLYLERLHMTPPAKE
jgi:uncharacterized protein YwbE